MNKAQLIYPEDIQPQASPVLPPIQEKHGIVYTRPWVVDLLLELAGYKPETNLVDAHAVEPAAGDGAFLVSMAQRLLASCKRQGRSALDCRDSLMAYELDENSAILAQHAVSEVLTQEGLTQQEATFLARSWVWTGDYLLEAPTLPRADFVVGNPPYIRLEDIDGAAASAYRTAYRTMTGRADIYVAFFEAALKQLKPGGVCAYICADRWMLNQYGSELRRLVTEGYAVEAVVEMHNANAFETDVSAYPAITVIRRAAQGPAVVASASLGVEAVGGKTLAASLLAVRLGEPNMAPISGLRATRAESWFERTDPWPCISPERLDLLKRLEAEFYPLESEGTGTKVGIGVATGLDEVFITTDPELVEPSRLLPLAMAYDTFDGTLQWSGHYLVDPWERGGLVDLARYPRLAAYYQQHEERLRKRNVAGRKPREWYRTIDRVNHALTKKPKLYIPDIKDTIHPVLDEGRTYPHHNLYYVQSECWDVEVLGGLLMSAVGQFFVECYGVRMRGGYLRFQAQYLRRIRAPRPQDLTPAQAEALAEAFRRRDTALATEIALAVYRIPGIPREDPDGY